MTRIACPVCHMDVSGSGREDLSHNLKVHMAQTHGLNEPSVGRPVPETGSTLYHERGRTYATRGSSVTPDPHYSVSVRGHEDMYGWREGEGGRPGEGRAGRGEMRSRVDCPVCGQPILARDEDALSDALEGHLRSVHDVRPRASARARTP